MFVLDEFSRINRIRCESADGFGHAINDWSLSDWITALTGELGEAANVVKKLNRIRDGVPGNGDASQPELEQKLGQELADCFIYLDLLAQAAGINLPFEITKAFNAKSEQIQSPIRFVYLGCDAWTQPIPLGSFVRTGTCVGQVIGEDPGEYLRVRWAWGTKSSGEPFSTIGLAKIDNLVEATMDEYVEALQRPYATAS